MPAQAIRVSDLTRPLAGIPLAARMVVLDLARANNFAQGGQPLAPGLALVDPEDGSLIAFNAAPGTIAPEEQPPYGAYAQALSEMMREGGLPVDEVFSRTRLRVNELTRGAVVPWHASKITVPFVFFERAPGAPAPLVSPQARAEVARRPIRDFPAEEAYAVAIDRDTIPAYQEFLVAYPSSPQARRVRAMLAARREALIWRRCVIANRPEAYWTYIRRYPRGPHIADARRRLALISAPLDPPAQFAFFEYDVPPPPPDEIEIIDNRRTYYFDERDYGPPPPAAPVLLIGPRERERDYYVPPPPPPQNRGFLPIPVGIPMPFARPVERQGGFAAPAFMPQPPRPAGQGAQPAQVAPGGAQPPPARAGAGACACPHRGSRGVRLNLRRSQAPRRPLQLRCRRRRRCRAPAASRCLPARSRAVSRVHPRRRAVTPRAPGAPAARAADAERRAAAAAAGRTARAARRTCGSAAGARGRTQAGRSGADASASGCSGCTEAAACRTEAAGCRSTRAGSTRGTAGRGAARCSASGAEARASGSKAGRTASGSARDAPTGGASRRATASGTSRSPAARGAATRSRGTPPRSPTARCAEAASAGGCGPAPGRTRTGQAGLRRAGTAALSTLIKKRGRKAAFLLRGSGPLPVQPRDQRRRVPTSAAHLLHFGIELVDQRGGGQMRVVAPRLGEADRQILAHPVDGKTEIEFAVKHGLVAVLHLPGLRRAFRDHVDHLRRRRAPPSARSADPRRGPAPRRRCRSG